MPSPASRPSFDELYARIRALPDHVTGQILEPGVLTTMGRPGLPQAHTQSMIDHWLQGFDPRRGGKGWWILREMEVRFRGDLLAVPDLVGWRVERVPTLPRENPFTLLPDWCCEVLSPSTARADRVLKLPLYARSGVRWIWLVEPEARFIEVYESVGERPVRVAGVTDEELAALPPFEGEAPVSAWWLKDV
ncbi:MAG TPA: Uma2 family endonuclease [Polyangiaceae bacterium]